MTTRAPSLEALENPVAAEFLAALAQPAAFPHPACNLRWHETHLSWVVLAGDYAYKLKKPVDLGFLDFTTRQQRFVACADEVRLNRRLCPTVYLGVAELSRTASGLCVRWPTSTMSPRAIVGEPLVWMRRLPEASMLPVRLAAGTVTQGLVGRLARRLARFHAVAATGEGVDEHGSLATIRRNWGENFAQMQPYLQPCALAERDADIARYVEQYLAEHAPLLAARVAAGRIREGHGDLHAANVAIEGRRLHLFDCIEFSRRFRCGDVAAEVAFLAMDLDHHGRADLALAFVDAYVRATGDEELRRLLPFYACYRAYVRGKVTSFRLAEPGLAPEVTAAIRQAADAYFDLAWSYTRPPAAPTLVVTMGPPASGKTVLAGALASRLGLVHLSSDVVRKELAGLAPTARRDDAFGGGLYAPAMTQRTYRTLRRRARHWLGRGRSVVLDATFGHEAERRWLPTLAAQAGSRLVVLACEADEATLLARLTSRRGEAGVTSDARPELWPALRVAYHPPAELPGVVPIDTTRSLPEVIARAMPLVSQAAPLG